MATFAASASTNFFASEIIFHLFKFVRASDLLKVYQLINNTTRNRIILYLRLLPEEGRHGARLISKDARHLFQQILDRADKTAVNLAVTKITEKAKETFLQKNVDAIRIDDETTIDYFLLHIGMFANWTSHLNVYNTGVFHYLYDSLNNDPSFKIEFPQWREVFIRDCQYWGDSYVFDDFIVLFERPDGTILVSSDMKRVYLALGGKNSVGELAALRYDSVEDILVRVAHPKKTWKLHGPLVGSRVVTVLLPWENKVASDLTIGAYEISPLETVKKAIAAYLHAVETNSIISRLEKKEGLRLLPTGRLDPAVLSERAAEVEKYREICKDDLEYIRGKVLQSLRENPKARVSSQGKGLNHTDIVLGNAKASDEKLLPHNIAEPGSVWKIFRHAYNEVDNLEHRIEIVVSPDRRLLHTFDANQLEPTVNEYIHNLRVAIERFDPGRSSSTVAFPSGINIDLKKGHLIDTLMSLLYEDKTIDLYVYYSPPATKMRMYFELHTDQALRSCVVCSKGYTPTGQLVMKCSQCKAVAYCCKEHQKKNWPAHRQRCSDLKQRMIKKKMHMQTPVDNRPPLFSASGIDQIQELLSNGDFQQFTQIMAQQLFGNLGGQS
jgi:hypothetical protein